MNKSESITKLAVALVKFQGEVTNPKNVADNPFFKSKYAPLDEVLNTVRPILSKHGLSVIQAPSTEDNNIVITTILLHESGEFIEPEPLKLKMDKVSAQGAGSSITYARRYALSSILGITSEEDDDGNIAEKQSKGNDKAGKDHQALKDNSLATDSQLSLIGKLMKDKNYSAESMVSYIEKMYDKKSSKELTRQEASALIEMLNGM